MSCQSVFPAPAVARGRSSPGRRCRASRRDRDRRGAGARRAESAGGPAGDGRRRGMRLFGDGLGGFSCRHAPIATATSDAIYVVPASDDAARASRLRVTARSPSLARARRHDDVDVDATSRTRAAALGGKHINPPGWTTRDYRRQAGQVAAPDQRHYAARRDRRRLRRRLFVPTEIARPAPPRKPSQRNAAARSRWTTARTPLAASLGTCPTPIPRAGRTGTGLARRRRPAHGGYRLVTGHAVAGPAPGPAERHGRRPHPGPQRAEPVQRRRQGRRVPDPARRGNPGAAQADEKIVATVQALEPDVAALMELENDGNGPDSAWRSSSPRYAAGDQRLAFRRCGQGPGTTDPRRPDLSRHPRVNRRQARDARRRPLRCALADFSARRWRRPSARAAAGVRRRRQPFQVQGLQRRGPAPTPTRGRPGLLERHPRRSAKRLTPGCPPIRPARRATCWSATSMRMRGRPDRTLLDAGWQDASRWRKVETPYPFVYGGRWPPRPRPAEPALAKRCAAPPSGTTTPTKRASPMPAATDPGP